MGRALLGGLIAGGQSPSRIRVADPVEACRQACATHHGVIEAVDLDGDGAAGDLASRPEIRARWNAAHPADRVEVPEAPKAPRPKRGGAK